MKYIVSRRFLMPDTVAELDRSWYFSLWKTRQWPYDRVEEGDTFYWYESPKQRVVWKARLQRCEKFEFQTVEQARRGLIDIFGPFDEDQPYFEHPPSSGYAMAYRTQAQERLNLPRPPGIRLPMLGWLPVTPEIERHWLHG